MSPVDGWAHSTLGQECSIEIGGTPSRDVAEYWDSSKQTPNLWVSIRDMNQRVITETAEHITDQGVKHSNAKLQAPGSVLLSFKLTIGRVAVAGRPLFTNEAIASLRPKRMDRDYLRYGLQHWDLLENVDQAIKGATLNKAKLKRIKCDFPDHPAEQQAIARVLTAVDRAIDQAAALVAKQQRVNSGLMRDLLTRGIDKDGKVRSEATHKFKESPLGRIPVEWEVFRLANTLVGAPKNGIYKPSSQIGRGTLLVGQTCFTSDRRINYQLARRAEISEAEMKAYGLSNGDILVTRVFATVEGIGRPVIVGDLPEPAVYESNMLRLQVEEKRIAPSFLFYWLASQEIRKRIAASVNASNQTSINQKVLNELPVPICDVGEQQRILSVITCAEIGLRQTTMQCEKYRALKTGLMQDLLTGRKRVTPLLESELVSVTA